MTRIAVLGPPGAGKTWLAHRLGPLLGIPVHDLDDLYWQAGWQRPAVDEWERLQTTLTESSSWLISGNYQPTAHIRICPADLVLVVNPGALVCLRRLVSRTIRIYRGDSAALPKRLRASGRRTAHRGLWRIAMIAVRYRRTGWPRTQEAARRCGVPVVEVRRRVDPTELARSLPTMLRSAPKPAPDALS